MEDVSNFPAIAALVIFGLAIVATLFLVFKAVALKLPVPGRRPFTIAVKYYIAPVIAVLAMLACTSMSIGDVGRGLLGNSQIQPYGILILFMSMAYIAGSLDATGLFAWLALKFTSMSGGRGHVLFLFYFLLSSFITTFTSNDVCILTLTPIVCYFAKATGVDPMPFLFAEYAAANTFGALLYTGNPTNIIVADAYNMTFLGYSKFMTLPTFAGGITCFLVLYLEFYRQIPKLIPLPTVDASQMLRDKFGAVFGSVNMLTCLGLLAAAPTLGWSMWAITLVCAGIHCLYNAWTFRSSLLHVPIAECWTCGCEKDTSCASPEGYLGADGRDDVHGVGGATPMKAAAVAEPADVKAMVRGRAGLSSIDCTAGAAAADSTLAERGIAIGTPAAPLRCSDGASADDSRSGQGPADVTGTRGAAGGCSAMVDSNGSAAVVGQEALAGPARLGSGKHATTGPILESIQAGPAPAPKLMLAMDADAKATTSCSSREGPGEDPVVTVDSLRSKAPTFWALLFDLPWEVVPFALGMFVLVEGLYVQGWLDLFGAGLGRASTTLPGAIFIMGFLSVALANTINNQPMTILLTRIALDASYTAYVGRGNTHKAALFALVLGSNIGAVFTLIGALAGILWSNIIGVHGLTVSYTHFARVCCPVGFMTLVVSLLVLWFEFAIFPHDD